MKKIAVVLVNYNGMKDTIECVESLETSDVPLNIIIVDNASPNKDGDYLKKLYKNDNNKYVIQASENNGFSAGNNMGIEYAIHIGCYYIALLNNDTIIDSSMFRKLIEHSSPDTVTIPLMCYYSKPTTVWFGGGKINRITGNGKSLNKGYQVDDIKSDIIQCTFATGCCILLNKEIIEKIGYLDENFFMYCEDIEYSVRMLKNSIKILLISDAKLWHKVGQSSGGEESSFALYYINRNRLNIVKENRDFFCFTAYIFSLLSRIYRMLQLLFERNGKWKSIWRAIKDHLNKIGGRVEIYE